MALPNDLDPYWLPFTANRAFKREPKLLASADGMYYRAQDGREVLDAVSGLWCVNAGHNRPRIVEAIQRQAATLDFSPQFQLAHSLGFELSSRLIDLAPTGFGQVFYCNSGSEAADSALKIALAYHQARGQGHRTRLIGREKGYHGVGFGGMSVGGLSGNRKAFGLLLTGVDHLRHTLDVARNSFSRGLPKYGLELAEDLERICALHDPSTIAAVIVEPVAGSAGVIPPPEGYLQRLREICDRHGILLIFDEVITGFGRLGRPFAADWFAVTPDIMTLAKGLTNGAVPMGAVMTRSEIYDTITNAAAPGIELAHGYTYSAHPLACAAALATLDTYAEEALFDRARDMAATFEDGLHSLAGLAPVEDIRNIGLMGAIQLTPRPDAPGARGLEVFNLCYDAGVLVRMTGDIIALSPPFIVQPSEIDRMVEALRTAILKVG